MKIKAKNKLWQYLFWLGPFSIAVGLTAGLVSENWGIVPLAFLIIGIAIAIFWLVLQSQQNNWWARRSTQAGTNAIVATLAVLVILVLINFLSTRYQWRVDLTETQLFTLAPQSQEIARSLKQPIKILVFDVNQNRQDRELLENYRRENPKLQFEYVDPQKKPGLAEKFGVKYFGEVYLESGNKRQLVQSLNEKEGLSEIKLTNSLQQIISDRTTKVYFLQGHGEHPISPSEDGMSQAVQGLKDKNYTETPLNLVDSSKFPNDASVVVVAGPKRGLFDSEVKLLQDYLNRGGNLLLMIDPNTETNLDTLLKDWGVRLDNRLAVDVSGSDLQRGPAEPSVTDYGQHPITKDFGNGISFYRLARPLEITPVLGIEATPLLKTKAYPDSWAESDLQNEKLEFNADKDLKGPLTLGVALSRKLPAKALTTPQTSPTISPLLSPTTTATPSPTTQNQTIPLPTTAATPSPTTQSQTIPLPTTAATPSPTTQNQTIPTPITAVTPLSEEKSDKPATESRLVVFGNSSFATDNLFKQQLNGDVFLNSLTWLSQQDQQPLSIRPKEPKNRRINLSTSQANFLIVSSLLGLPLIGLIAAAVIWWKRR